VEIFTFNRAIKLNNRPDPNSLEQAQFSLPFCLAAAALMGPEALSPMLTDLLGRSQLADFARKVSLQHDPELEAAFPARAGARLVVHTARGAFIQEVQHPRGDPANPLSGPELTAKFFKLAGMLAGREKAQAILKATMELKHTSVGPLMAALGELDDERVENR